jgi:hypothetical protein
VSACLPYSHPSLKRLGIASSSIFSALLLSSSCENNLGGSSAGFFSLFSSKLDNYPSVLPFSFVVK